MEALHFRSRPSSILVGPTSVSTCGVYESLFLLIVARLRSLLFDARELENPCSFNMCCLLRNDREHLYVYWPFGFPLLWVVCSYLKIIFLSDCLCLLGYISFLYIFWLPWHYYLKKNCWISFLNKLFSCLLFNGAIWWKGVLCLI